MISLNVYLTPKDGRANELERAIAEVWMTAMEAQPGFIRAAMITPFTDSELAAVEASKPPHAYEVVSYWTSEEERQAWAARDIHQEVWPQVVKETESVSYTLFNVSEGWNM